MFKKVRVFVIFLLISVIECNENEENDVFVATKEWQVVKKGQKIPKGLHVRINLETGLTEAKLLDDDKNNALSELPQDTVTISQQDSIKKIDDDLFTPDQLKNIKDKFRTYDEIKKSLGDLNLTPKIDAEVIADLLKKHKETSDFEELVTILEDLDFLAHQYDNAHEFIKQNGFKEVIYKNLNSTKAEIRKKTLKLMSALLQNNVNPKIHALETGSVGVLLRLLNFDADAGVKNAALTALGALLRSFPVAQKSFVESGGLSVLSSFFKGDDIKLQVKLITMISDLIIEHKFASTDDNLSKYYINFDLKSRVLEHDWCKKLDKLLLGLLITDKDDHDSIEKCLTAMHSLKDDCWDKYDKDLLMNLLKLYEGLSSEDSFFSSLEKLCDEILYKIHNVKTEL